MSTLTPAPASNQLLGATGPQTNEISPDILVRNILDQLNQDTGSFHRELHTIIFRELCASGRISAGDVTTEQINAFVRDRMPVILAECR